MPEFGERLERDALRAMGADPVVADALDGPAVASAVEAARPEAVIHQLTSLPPRIDPRKIGRASCRERVFRTV